MNFTTPEKRRQSEHILMGKIALIMKDYYEYRINASEALYKIRELTSNYLTQEEEKDFTCQMMARKIFDGLLGEMGL